MGKYQHHLKYNNNRSWTQWRLELRSYGRREGHHGAVNDMCDPSPQAEQETLLEFFKKG